MSRIEKALQKAASKRKGMPPQGAPVPRPEDRPGTTSPPPAADRETMERPVSPYLVTLTEPLSPIAEEYRKLKSMIVKLTKHGGFKNTLMVTSSLGNEGKSLTALNLAVTLSEEYDHTVLLIDADLRNPTLHRYLDLAPGAGLADCLVDGLDAGKAMMRPGIGKLSFMPSGRAVGNPVELLSSRKMKDLIGELKHRYSDRYIIIDTPPVLSVAETCSLSPLVDGIVFVVREGLSSVDNIRDSLDILKDGNVLGLVFTGVSVENLNGRYHYYRAYRGYPAPKEDSR
jgi:protein-tyrosine kinase